MRDYMEIINFINKIKYKLEHSDYSSGDDLQRDIYNIRELLWSEINNIHTSDLNNLCKVHEYLIDEVCKMHKKENDSCNHKLFKESLNIKELNSRLKDGKRASNIYVFNNHEYEYYFIGDLHSDSFSLNRIMTQCNFFNNIIEGKKVRFIFLGDYVDRGKAHLKLLQNILILKYIFPENIYLLRGNHDGGSVNEGKVKLCVGKPKDASEDDFFLMYILNLSQNNSTFNLNILDKYLEFFNSLCNIAFVNHKNKSILAVHGGIPRARKDALGAYNYINCISDLTNDTIEDNIKRTIVHNMLWSDPYNNQGDLREDSGRFRFTFEQFEEFRNTIGFDILIRGHQAEKEGYKNHFDDRLFTIFSSGAILESNENINNETAYEDVAPKIIKLDKESEIQLAVIDIG